MGSISNGEGRFTQSGELTKNQKNKKGRNTIILAFLLISLFQLYLILNILCTL